MAVLRLSRSEVETGQLPSLCMRCGAPATGHDTKKFSWHPQWVYALILAGLLPLLIVALIMTKRMNVRAPFCDAHRSHWSWRSRTLIFSFIGLAILGVCGFVLAVENKNSANPLSGALCVGCVLLGLAWVILAICLQSTSIEPREITDASITLDRVALGFCDAVMTQRQMNPFGRFDDEFRRVSNNSTAWIPITIGLLFFGGLIAVVALAAITTVGKPPPAPPVAAVAPQQVVTEAGENFRLRTNNPEWTLFTKAEAQKLNQQASAGAQRNDGLVSCVVLVVKPDDNLIIEGHEQELGQAWINSSKAAKKHTDSIDAVDFRGVKAVRNRFSGKINGAWALYDYTVFIYGGKLYFLYCAGPIDATKQTFQPFLDAFELLPMGKAPEKP